MRRGMRHAHLLGAKDPLMYRLVPALVAEMGAAFPELVRAQPLIEATLQQDLDHGPADDAGGSDDGDGFDFAGRGCGSCGRDRSS